MTQSNPYESKPYEHLQKAEGYAKVADTSKFPIEDSWRQWNATLSLAHATIALAQMIGSQRMT
jgi:hypothetical protein